MFNFMAIVFSILMISAYFIADNLKPTKYMAELKKPEALQEMFPKVVGGWETLNSEIVLIKASDVEEKLNAIYSDMLERHYKDKNNNEIFLSLAYGADQSSDQTQVHRPEFCYPAQGFEISHVRDELIVLSPEHSLLVRRLLAQAPGRIEPITYWLVIGDKATLPGWSRKWIQLEYGLEGKIPDGLLFRVSSITQNVEEAYQNHDDFVKELFRELDTKQKSFIFGLKGE